MFNLFMFSEIKTLPTGQFLTFATLSISKYIHK
jgi:hypothetical protein